MATKLTDEQRDNELVRLFSGGWAMVYGRDAITRTFKFKSFSAAFGWMTRVAMVAEQMNHHPEWSNTYNCVEVVLATHSIDGLSELDLEMARVMDDIAK